MSKPATVLALLGDSQHPALVDCDGGWTLSHAELRHAVEALAEQLYELGVRPGDGVAIVMENSAATIVTFLAVVRASAIAQPINSQLRQGEVEAELAEVHPALMLIGDGGHDEAIAAAEAADIAVHAVSHGPPPALDGVTRARGALADVDPEAVALLLHTSGTTSRPKAVPLRHRNLAASATGIAAGYGLGPDDVSYCVMPLFHVHGLVASTLAALAGGGTVVVPRRTRPGALWPHVHEHGVTWFSAVPTILAKLRAAPDGDHGSLRFARSCSSSLAPPLWTALEERFGVPVVEAYGMTEASHQMTSNPLPPGDRRPGTVGITASADVAILDADWQPVPAGTAGEVSVRGPGVVDGYLDNPEANAASFRDGWFRTGDLGRLSDDGYLTLDGRLKELINRGGEKIAPREIDEALLSHPAVREAVAYGVPDDKWGEVVDAAVVVDDGLSADELRDFCSDRLAAFKVPRRVHIVTEIPKGPTGKIQRRTLAEALDA
jgi:acyl-CoA synthetase (AMP-forming)/AMP-acid ligase II